MLCFERGEGGYELLTLLLAAALFVVLANNDKLGGVIGANLLTGAGARHFLRSPVGTTIMRSTILASL